ncbi:hypothetical protein D3C72_178200 [compost metagenome]
MLIRLDRPLQINLELATLIFFAAIGYAYLFKYNFYATLGVSWFTGNLTPSYLFFSSISYIIAGCLGALLGWLLITLRNKKFWRYLQPILVVSFVSLSFLILGFNDWLYTVIGIYTKNVLWVFYLSLTTFYVFNFLFQLEYSENKSINFSIMLMLLSAYIIVPTLSGSLEAKTMMNNPSYTASKLKLKGSSEDWYLVDYVNDKAILMQKQKTHIFKIVEYKDIIQIDNSSIQFK